MLRKGLFEKTIQYQGDAYRNIVGLKESRDPFADLAEGDSVLSATAVDLTRRTSGVPHSDVSVMDFLYPNAIGYSFDHEPLFPTRFGDGTFSVWYGSKSLETSIYESVYHFIRIETAVDGPDQAIYRERAVFLVGCNAILIDLMGKEVDFPSLLSDDYSDTQEIGRQIQKEGHPGILAPSARHKGGANLVIFSKDVLSHPRQHSFLSYVLDPTDRAVIVTNEEEKIVVTIPY